MRRSLVVSLAVGVACWAASSINAEPHSDHGCKNCHVPHNAGDPDDPDAYGVPLWSNAQTSDGVPNTFTLYTSQTLNATPTQPDGPSKMCLGCHDGSYSYVTTPARLFTTETGLARSHPVSFVYDSALATADGGLKNPAVDPSGFGRSIALDLLDSKGKMQCTACHDIHTSGITENMLRWDYDTSNGARDMCRTCHNK
jgi:predicted CXXCH cytochrome family protein